MGSNYTESLYPQKWHCYSKKPKYAVLRPLEAVSRSARVESRLEKTKGTIGRAGCAAPVAF